MHSILFIANGPEASMVTDVALRRQQGVVTRASTPQEATLLLASGSFDAIVCAVDSLDVTARQCIDTVKGCLLYTSPSPRDATLSRMPSSA